MQPSPGHSAAGFTRVTHAVAQYYDGRDVAPRDLRAPRGRSGAAPGISVRFLRPHERRAGAWNDFAARCPHATFLSDFHYARLAFPARRLKAAELWLRDASGARKIGQALVLCGGGGADLPDGLRLLPGQEGDWARCMQALLAALGPGQYRYGSPWSGEPPRQAALAAMQGVRVEDVRALAVHIIEFERFPDWDSYTAGFCTNLKRNLKRAAHLPDIHIDVHRGLAAARQVLRIDRLRRATLLRKGVSTHPGLRHWSWNVLRFLLRAAALRGRIVVGLARAQGAPCAVVSMVEYGPAVFYMEGGSTLPNAGAAWQLLIAMIERAWRRDGSGRFVMGFEDAALRDSAGWANLVRSRLQCRARPVDSSQVRFSYSGG